MKLQDTNLIKSKKHNLRGSKDKFLISKPEIRPAQISSRNSKNRIQISPRTWELFTSKTRPWLSRMIRWSKKLPNGNHKRAKWTNKEKPYKLNLKNVAKSYKNNYHTWTLLLRKRSIFKRSWPNQLLSWREKTIFLKLPKDQKHRNCIIWSNSQFSWRESKKSNKAKWRNLNLLCRIWTVKRSSSSEKALRGTMWFIVLTKRTDWWRQR